MVPALLRVVSFNTLTVLKYEKCAAHCVQFKTRTAAVSVPFDTLAAGNGRISAGCTGWQEVLGLLYRSRRPVHARSNSGHSICVVG